MVEQLPTQWGPLCLVVFGLGMRHGLDADHLAAIDGLTRFNAQSQPRLARLCGALFALGHGVLVIIVALAVGSLAHQWRVPRILEDAGACISIAYLLFLGLINVVTVMHTAPGQTVRIVGLRGRCLGGRAGADRAWLVALTGALFAISFDTLTQAALFALLGAQFGGLLFTLGFQHPVHDRDASRRWYEWIVVIAVGERPRAGRSPRLPRNGPYYRGDQFHRRAPGNRQAFDACARRLARGQRA